MTIPLVLFVSSGNHPSGFSPVVKKQADSLSAHDVRIDFFSIKRGGLWGYLKSIPAIRKKIRKNRYNMVHAHYSLSGICAAVAAHRSCPVFCSLMGSDAQITGIWRSVIRLFARKWWQVVIIKSFSMNKKLALKDYVVLPNGVDLEQMRPMDQADARKKIGWNSAKKYILFLADPKRPEKNYQLAREAVECLDIADIELKAIGACPHEDVPLYLNACDVLLLTSLWEGSPNVIKEAMACNRPIVSTDVGDVRKIFGDTRGCYIASFNRDDVAEKLILALEFSSNPGQTSGRQQIISLGLSADAVALQLVDLYSRFSTTDQ
jgi:glycosyltransferase involved in cell wall biosynthesis